MLNKELEQANLSEAIDAYMVNLHECYIEVTYRDGSKKRFNGNNYSDNTSDFIELCHIIKKNKETSNQKEIYESKIISIR